MTQLAPGELCQGTFVETRPPASGVYGRIICGAQALEGAPVAPGHDRTLRELGNAVRA